MHSWKMSRAAVLQVLAFAALLAAVPLGRAQCNEGTTGPSWELAAGGKMSFEVASIRPSKPGSSTPANISMEIDDYYAPTGGLFRADRTLLTYINFAYKLHPTAEQRHAMFDRLPSWVSTQTFTINARAATNVTKKDQMRLMMQALLAERFHLVVHSEQRSTPVYALTFVEPGKMGPNLRPHREGPSCDVPVSRRGLVPPAGKEVPASGSMDFPFACGRYDLMVEPDHLILWGSRDVSMETLATWIAVTPPASFGRPVVDQTGISGTVDFTLEWRWTPDADTPAESEAEVRGPTVEEALKQQLGMKLKPTSALVPTLVIDHVELPSAN